MDKELIINILNKANFTDEFIENVHNNFLEDYEMKFIKPYEMKKNILKIHSLLYRQKTVCLKHLLNY